MYNESNNTRNIEFQERLRGFLEPTSTRVILVVAFILIFLVLPISLGIYNSKFSAKIVLDIAPSDSKILVGDKVARPGDTVRVEPGNYMVIVTRDGFFSYAEEVNLENGDSKMILAALDSSDESTADWYLNHPEDDSIASGAASAKYFEESEEYVREYPIVDVLPIIEDFYRIDYGFCQQTDGDFCIIITALAGARSRAANRLMGLSGYDAAQYKIEYQQFSDPFKGVSSVPNKSGVTVYDEDLPGAKAVLDAIIQPLNSRGFNMTNEGALKVEMENSSYAIGRINHHLSDGGVNTYKVILQLREDGWAIVAVPKLVYSYQDYPNLPRDVIYRANH